MQLPQAQQAALTSISGKHIAVLGMGVEGYSSAMFLAKHGAHVDVLDRKETVEEPQE